MRVCRYTFRKPAKRMAQSYLFLDLLRSVVSCIKQGLAGLIGGSKTVFMSIDLPLGHKEDKLALLLSTFEIGF